MKQRLRNVKWEILVAAASLVAAIVFNSVEVRAGADAQREARVATELGVLTQLQGVMNQSVYSRTPYQRQFQELRARRRGSLTPAAYRAVAQEASNMNYFAWLFNRGYLTIGRADELWGPLMICEYQQAFAPAIPTATQDYPDLVQFIEARGKRLSQLASCQ